MGEVKKIVLAYSGGLDTSAAIKWLQETYRYEVIAVTLDVGENKDLQAIKEKALRIGAIDCHIVDAQDIFAQEYLLLALQANALYEGKYPLISALSRPLIAKMLVNIAHQQGAQAIAHGCTGKGNDQVRFDVAIRSLAPKLDIIAPMRETPMPREQMIAFAAKHNIPVPITTESPFSIDINLWGRSCECGVLEDPWSAPPEAAYGLTQSPESAPQQAEIITLDFQHGVPVAINNKHMSLVELIKTLNQLAGRHGVGRIDMIENRLVGIKSREVYEAPAAVTLIKAHQALESLTLTRDLAHFKPLVEQRFTNLVYEGYWFSPLKRSIQAFINTTQETVTGQVRMKLYKGQAVVDGLSSERALYQLKLATYTPEDEYDHQAAAGFTKIWGLPLQINNSVNPLDSGSEEDAS